MVAKQQLQLRISAKNIPHPGKVRSARAPASAPALRLRTPPGSPNQAGQQSCSHQP